MAKSKSENDAAADETIPEPAETKTALDDGEDFAGPEAPTVPEPPVRTRAQAKAKAPDPEPPPVAKAPVKALFVVHGEGSLQHDGKTFKAGDMLTLACAKGDAMPWVVKRA